MSIRNKLYSYIEVDAFLLLYSAQCVNPVTIHVTQFVHKYVRVFTYTYIYKFNEKCRLGINYIVI